MRKIEQADFALDDLSREALDELPIGAIKVDSEGNVLVYNLTEQTLSGRAPAQVLGRNFFTDVAPCTNLPGFHGRFLEGVATGRLEVDFQFVFDFKMDPVRVAISMRNAREPDRYWILVEPLEYLKPSGTDQARAVIGERLSGARAVWSDADFCAREPIHVPGAIQPHGALLVVDRARETVLAASANLTEFVAWEGGSAIGAELATVLGPDVAAAIRDIAANPRHDPGSPERLQCNRGPGGGQIDLLVHATEAYCHVEIEHAAWTTPGLIVSEARNWVWRECNRLSQIENLDDLLQDVAGSVRAFTGAERVLIYRFETDMSGTVMAEDKVLDWEQSFIGFSFPASDIPAQARGLYLRSRVRHMPDNEYEPVALQVDPAIGAPDAIDLSNTRLRAMSPMHREYQRAMGVGASFSISIIRAGRLWGLLIGHSRVPHYVPANRLSSVALLVDMLAERLEQGLTRQEVADQKRHQEVLNRILKQIVASDTIVRGLTYGERTIKDLFHATGGVVLHLGGSRVHLGETPPDPLVDKLASWLSKHAEDEVWAGSCLMEHIPEFGEHADIASGALALFFGPARQDVIIWFRPGLSRTRVWAGRPGDGIDAKDSSALMARRSFERWIEVSYGTSEPWAGWMIDMARNLRYAIMEVVATQAERLQHVNMALEQSNRVKTDFLSMMSHELRTPLNAILGFAQLIQSKAEKPEARGRIANYAATIQQAGEHLLSLINDILQYARLDAGRGDLSLGPTAVAESVSQAMAIVAPLADQRGIVISTRRPAEDLVVRGDRRALDQVLINLLGNAVKYSGGRSIAILISAAGETVEIAVEDDGAGFPPFVLANSFQPFLQEDPQVSRQQEGSGLGLALCKLLIDQMQGGIELTNRPEGGARVRVTLPIWRPRKQPALKD